MPLFEINQTHYISVSVRLDEAITEQVDQYAAFVHASADDIVDKALNYISSKDRDFQNFLKTPQAKEVPSTLRVRKGPSNGASEEPAKKLVAGGGVTAFCARGEGVILHSSFCLSKNGASHRKNCDSPPLIGNCPDTLVSRQIPLKKESVKSSGIWSDTAKTKPPRSPVAETQTIDKRSEGGRRSRFAGGQYTERMGA